MSDKLYYVRIPLRHLGPKERLNVPDDERDARWADRVENLLGDIRQGVIPAWAVDYRDLRNVVLEHEPVAEQTA